MVNGRLIRSRRATVSIFDRSFQLGDGAFTTVRVTAGWPLRWRHHWSRLAGTARTLGIRLPLGQGAALGHVLKLIARNRAAEAVLRIHLTRGCGPRGYSPRGAVEPQLIMAMHPAGQLQPSALRSVRLGLSTLAGSHAAALQSHKTASRVSTVLVRAAAEAAGFDDALWLDERNHVLEATSSNFFWFHRRQLVTPPLVPGVLPGTTRALVIQLARRRGLSVSERLAACAQIQVGAGAFLTVSTEGLVEVREIAGHQLPVNPLTALLHRELLSRWRSEARAGLARQRHLQAARKLATA